MSKVLPVQEEDAHSFSDVERSVRASRLRRRGTKSGAHLCGDASRYRDCRRREVCCGDRIVEEHVSADAQMRAPMLEVRAHSFFTVVTVNEEQVDRLARRLNRSRVGDMQLHALAQPVPLERSDQLAVERVAVASLSRVDVVRVQDALAVERRCEQEGAAAAVAPDLDDEVRLELADEPVEERGLVETQRSDPVCEHRAREEKGQVFEPVDPLRPARHVSEVGPAPLPVCDHELADEAAQEPRKRQTLGQGWSHGLNAIRGPSRSRSSSRPAAAGPISSGAWPRSQRSGSKGSR